MLLRTSCQLLLGFALAALSGWTAAQAQGPDAAAGSGRDGDPLASPAWPTVRAKIVGGDPLVFDPRVVVSAPDIAEDSMNVPVTVALSLDDVRRVVVVADLNPILRILEFEPLRAAPRVSFRFKLQQASPIRALAQTGDGTWHVGGRWIDASGGGCTAPSVGTSSGSWSDTLGLVDARWWSDGDQKRLKFRVMHPMDTGLAPGIPAFFVERLALVDANGTEWMRLQTYEPISENPMFSIEMPGNAPPLSLIGRDNNGNLIRAELTPR